MKLTSKKADKLLEELQDDLNNLLKKERQNAIFVSATNEDLESNRPEYSYEEAQKEIDEINSKIRTVKHAISIFNTTTIVKEFNMNIDELLVYIKQLKEDLLRLTFMRGIPAKRRNDSVIRGNVIDYEYANFDTKVIEDKCKETLQKYNKAHLILNDINTNTEFEIDI